MDSISIKILNPHPANARIYGDASDADLIAKIKKHGFNPACPILITKPDVYIEGLKNVVISGHRRIDACLHLGIDDVPVVVSDKTDPLEIEELLIDMNSQREKTAEQKAREYQRLKAIAAEKGKANSGTRTDLLEKLPKGESVNAREDAAAKVGMSGKTAESAGAVIEVIDALEADGDKQKADELRDKLNNGSVTAAHRAAKPIIEKKKEIVKEAKKNPFEIEKLESGLFVAHATNPKYNPSFNATNDNIEWAKWSWNPVTGCLHGCEYCYARAKATNSYYKDAFPTGFAPTFHPGRLSAPQNTRIPDNRKHEPGINNVFVCSMADLFGDWVPAEWINAVLDSCRSASQFNFLFLTKNPARYIEFKFPDNAWLGATADTQERADAAIEAFDDLRLAKAPDEQILFLSCEPLLEEIVLTGTDINWLIIGGLKGSENSDKQPKWEWVELLMTCAREKKSKVYFKPNLTVRPMEYPE